MARTGSAEERSVFWEGVPSSPGDREPFLVLPYTVRKVLALPSGKLVILDEAGKLAIHHDKKTFPLEIQPSLPPIKSISIDKTSAQEGSNAKTNETALAHRGDIDQESEEPDIICLLELGLIYKVSLSSGECSQFESPGRNVVHFLQEPDYQLICDASGGVWSRGSVPFTGHVHQSNLFQKVPFFSGMSMLSVVGGSDFNVCIVKPEVALRSPETPQDEATDVDGPSCPLGLHLNLGSNLTKTQSSSGCEHPLVSSTTTSTSSSQPLPPPKPPSLYPQNKPCPDETDQTPVKGNHSLSAVLPGQVKDGWPVLNVSTSSGGSQKDVSPRESSHNSTQSSSCTSESRNSLRSSSSSLLPEENSNSSLQSSSSSLMHPLALTQDPVGLEAEKCSSEPPSGRTSTRNLASVDDFEMIEKGMSSRPSTFRNFPRRSASIHSSLSHRGLCLKDPSLQELCAQGAELRDTEVWVWGAGGRGQLGQGDLLSRPSPVTIPELSSQSVLKVSAGSQHALALTAAGQVYGWGNNNRGQSNPSDTLAVVPHPTKLNLPRGETVRDILAVKEISLMVCDSGNIYHTGLRQNTRSRLHCLKLESLGLGEEMQPFGIVPSNKCFIINVKPFHKHTVKLVSREKMLLDQVDGVANLISALHPTSPNSKNKPQTPLLDVWDALKKARNLLTFCVSRSLRQASLRDYSFTGLYRNLTAWRTCCLELCWFVGNCISVDCLLLDSHQNQHRHTIVDLLTTKFSLHQQSIKGQLELEQLLLELYKLSECYIKALMELQPRVENGKPLLDKISELMDLHQSVEKQRQDAEDTRSFWKTAGSKLKDLCIPSRRLVLDNRNQPIALSGHMSRHWIILLSDILVVVGYNVAVYPLVTVWLEAPPISSSGNKYEVILVMPEETKSLLSSTPATRNVWIKGLVKSIAESTRIGSHLPPITRAVNYEFSKGELKGAVYKGSMTQARMHGRGSLEYSDGSSYTGEWRNGVQQGWGILKTKDGTTQEGTWKSGRLTGRGIIREPDGSCYEGDLLDAQPHGHGIKKEGKFMGCGASVYVGEWEKGVRHGYGVIDDIMVGEKYMGLWVGGARHGLGCVVNSDGIYYEGNFVTNKLTGGGTMIFEDDAIYEGEFAGAGEFNGKGVLVTKTSRFDGVFHGNYSDGMRFNGTVYKHAEPGTPLVEQSNRKVQIYKVLSARKWRSVFVAFESLLGSEDPWNQVAVAVNQAKVTARERGEEDRIQDLDFIETIPDVKEAGGDVSWGDYQDILRYLSTAATCTVHPFSRIIKLLVQAFNMSYGGVRSHPTLLPHATEELESISVHLYILVRKLFPALPVPNQQMWICNPEDNDELLKITEKSLIYPLLLSSLYPTLFQLYIQREQGKDKEYWARILRWNKHTDAALLTFFDVEFSVWDLPVERRSRDQLFVSAIYSLQRLKTTFTPVEKLDVIVETFKAITAEAGTSGHTWSMDSLLPVCMYVVVRARVLQLGAELAMLSDLMETYLFQGEKGIMFTTLQAAYAQILRENVFIN